MNATDIGIAASLAVLTTALGALAARGFARFVRNRVRIQLMWGLGLAFATVATGVELVVFLGVVSGPLLETYVFLSAAIVGFLSLGSTQVIRNTVFRRSYTAYILATCAAVAVLSFATPLPNSMVTSGVISGNPPLELLVVSSLVTVPATLVLLAAVVVALRRSWKWQTLMMGIGACVLAAGGALYIASFPVALYYSEFIGIVLIFFGLVSLPHLATSPASAARSLSKSG